MMQLRALVLDCFRDALDRKLFWVMAGISAFIALLMACISFDETGVHLFFGIFNSETDQFAPGNPAGRGLIGLILTKYIGDFYIGFIGVLIALVGTCGIFPAMMERGAVDVLLAKPISRPTLFLGKYLGAMTFVLLQATIFIVLTFLVVGLRWKYWMPAYLWSIPLIVLLFSYIYCFTALFGVWTRSAMSALLLSVLAWVGIFAVQVSHETLLTLPAMGMEVDPRWVRGAEFAKTLVPKTRDVTWIAAKLINADFPADVPAPPPPEKEEAGKKSDEESHGDSNGQASLYAPDMEKVGRAQLEIADVPIARSIISSLLFETAVVCFAMWKFCRRDF